MAWPGVGLFLLLGGYPPFEGDSREEIEQLILAASITFDEHVWEAVSEKV